MTKSISFVIAAKLLAIAAFGFLGTSLSCSAMDLIQNSGFEAEPGLQHWNVNNWANLNANFTLDTTNPHSGKYCLKMHLIENGKGTNIQLIQNLSGKLKSGDDLRIGFWVRGADNTPPIDVALNQGRPPWKDFVLMPVRVASTWEYHEFYVSINETMDFESAGLFIYLRTEDSVWLDDISVEIAPAQMGGAPLQGNRVQNNSFEVGRDKWYFNVVPHGGWRQANKYVRTWEKMSDNPIPSVVTIPDAPHGENALYVKTIDGTRGHITSAYFDLRYGHSATFSFDLKSSQAWENIYASVGNSGDASTRSTYGKYFHTVENTWQHFQYTFKPKPSPGNRYCFEIIIDSPGEFWIDNIQVNEGNSIVQSKISQANIGWASVGNEVPGHLYQKNDELKLRVLAEEVSTKKKIHLSGKVIDVYENVLAQKEFEIQLSANRKGEHVSTLPTNKFGAFKYVVKNLGSPSIDGTPAMEWQYQVLPQLKPLSEVRDFFFGGHSPLTPMALEVAEKVGIRSIRLHPPLNTKWRVVEPIPDKWDFDTARQGLKRAHKKGFDLLGMFDATPNHRAALPSPKPPETWIGYGNYPPKQWSAYREYVKRSIIAFRDLIRDWEVWNEPDIDFLKEPIIEEIHGKDKEELYLKIVEQTRESLDKNGFDINLVVGAVSALNNGFTREILNRNVTQYGDVFSFHMYGHTLTLNRLNIIQQVQATTNHKRQPTIVWHSEGAFFPTIVTWLRTPRLIAASPDIAGYMVNNTVIRMAELKAYGVERNYHYPQPFDTLTGRQIYRTDFSSGWDCAGNPLPLWAAHAASVKFLEGATPDGEPIVKYEIGDAKISVARFWRDEEFIEVLWSSSETSLWEIPLFNMQAKQAFDIMGNAMDISSETKISENPIYLVEKK